MTLLKAIPLSFAIFWRMLIMTPLLAALLAALAAAVGVVGFIFAFFMPFTFMLLYGMFWTLVLSVIPILLAARTGLTLLGQKPLIGAGNLTKPAALYGLIIAVFTLLMLFLTTIAFGLQVKLPLAEFAALSDTAKGQMALVALATNEFILMRTLLVATCISSVFFASLMMPLAAASIGRDINGHRHTPLAGFGVGVMPIFALIVIGQMISFLSSDAFLWGIAQLGLSASFDAALADLNLMAQGLIDPAWNHWFGVVIALYLILSLWLLSLQCAGAALVFADQAAQTDFIVPETAPKPRMAPKEARALWQSRMPHLDRR